MDETGFSERAHFRGASSSATRKHKNNSGRSKNGRKFASERDFGLMLAFGAAPFQEMAALASLQAKRFFWRPTPMLLPSGGFFGSRANDSSGSRCR